MSIISTSCEINQTSSGSYELEIESVKPDYCVVY